MQGVGYWEFQPSVREWIYAVSPRSSRHLDTAMDGYSPFRIARGGQHWGLRERFIADSIAVPTPPPLPESARRPESGRRQILEQVISSLGRPLRHLVDLLN